MPKVDIAEAQARLVELIHGMDEGTMVEICRGDTVVAVLRAPGSAAPARPALDLDALKRLRARMPAQAERAGDFVRSLRDSDPS
jgi:antitoxin (DNA-binding transcriptional repressor) of toxin-antitoxin stability system